MSRLVMYGLATGLFFICFISFLIPAILYTPVYNEEKAASENHVEGNCLVRDIYIEGGDCACGDECTYICYRGDWLVAVTANNTNPNKTKTCNIESDYSNVDEDDQETDMKSDYQIGNIYSCWYNVDDLSDCRWDEPDEEYYRGVIMALWIISVILFLLTLGGGIAFGIQMRTDRKNLVTPL